MLDPAITGGNVLDAQKGVDPNNPNAQQEKEVQNARALQVLARIKDKLTGKDFVKEGLTHSRAAVERLNGGHVGKQANGDQVNGHVDVAAGDATMAEAGGLGINEQVEKLIEQATKVEHLCQHYIGWCSFW